MSDSTLVAFNLTSPRALVYKNHWVLKTLVTLSLLSFLTTLTLPYQGEEGVYTITSLEMWLSQQWLNPTVFGIGYARPPFLNWFMIPLASFLGWENILLASRCISAISTFITTGILFWLSNTLFRSKSIAWFSAALFLSGDLLLRRGWLAYADPLFALGIFSAIAFSLIALEKRKVGYLIFSCVGITAAFLTKAMTAYFFYFISLLVLFWKHPNRRLLLSPLSIVAHLFAFSFPFIWDNFISHAAHSQSMLNDVLNKLSLNEMLNYGIKLLVFPLDTLWRLFPGSGVALYFLWENKRKNNNWLTQNSEDSSIAFNRMLFSILVWITFFNFLPYWLAPKAHVRYLLPLYPVCALILAYLIYHLGERAIKTTVFFLITLVIIKYCLGFWGYRFIETQVRGNYLAVAQDILNKTEGASLCASDDTATGLSVIAHLNVLRLPNQPIQACQRQNSDISQKTNSESITGVISSRIDTHDTISSTKEYLLVEKPEHLKDARIYQVYTLGRNKLYLMVRESSKVRSLHFKNDNKIYR